VVHWCTSGHLHSPCTNIQCQWRYLQQ
jgi:hypothetical protein